jgi:GNAT superfamily N-acetyltransferase
MDCLPLSPGTPHFRAATDRYATIHGEPVESVRERFTAHTRFDSYRGFVAVDDAGRVVGYGYGHGSQVGQPYHDRLRETLDATTYDRWLTDCFELVELGVSELRRREGVATRLHERVFGGVERATTVLTTEADNEPARAFYESHGWSVVREPFRVVDTEMVVYGRRLDD